MEANEKIRAFAEKWLEKFRDRNSTNFDLADHFLSDDCAMLGFKMDCGDAFGEKYGSAVYSWEQLFRIIDEVDDIALLGSAIYSRWRYFNHWAAPGENITDEENRKWFIIALERMEILAQKTGLFRGTIQKMRLVSSDLCYGPMPEPDDEVEQRLTLNDKGRVWFSSYNFGLPETPARRIREKRFGIEAEAAQKLLANVADYFGHEHEDFFVTDVGMWQLELTNTEGETYKFAGSMGAEILVDDVDLSEQFRRSLAMEDLFAFDGNNKPESINRIVVDYHRVTRIKPAQQEETELEIVTWDYSEQLIIDRQTETLEHTQIVGTGCKISHKYEIEGEIENLLDSLDPDSFFSYIEETQDDVIENPMETKDYRITIDFDRTGQRVLTGEFDQDGLPSDFPEFAEAILDFIRFYGIGEILNPDIYKKQKRRKNDYTYCSVKFGDGYKTYHYISDDDSISEGDWVVVPVGPDNQETKVQIMKVEYFSPENVPFPVEKTKHILRRTTENEPISQNNEESTGWCPALEREVDEIECIEVCDVADDLINESILEDYDPPVFWTEEMKKKCRTCKYHLQY